MVALTQPPPFSPLWDARPFIAVAQQALSEASRATDPEGALHAMRRADDALQVAARYLTPPGKVLT